MLELDQLAPEFGLPDQNGNTVRLSDFEGKRVVLFFYPRAGTRGCTAEACSFRDAWDDFERNGIAVLGISNDPVEEILAFKREEDLPFTLLSDESGEVATAYESYGAVERNGETRRIAFRNTYVIDEDGYIERAYEDVSPENHAEEILAGSDTL